MVFSRDANMLVELSHQERVSGTFAVSQIKCGQSLCGPIAQKHVNLSAQLVLFLWPSEKLSSAPNIAVMAVENPG
jgi:hypothetical protein